MSTDLFPHGGPTDIGVGPSHLDRSQYASDEALWAAEHEDRKAGLSMYLHTDEGAALTPAQHRAVFALAWDDVYPQGTAHTTDITDMVDAVAPRYRVLTRFVIRIMEA